MGTEVEPIMYSSDPNFRPTDIEIGPDGAIYFTDWQNPIIGHMQHNLRDPSRDREHGRVYRISYPDRPLLTPPKIAGQPIDSLLDLLKDSGDRVRYRTRIELGSRNSSEVLAALDKWTESLDPKDPQYEHHMMEALWLHQSHNVVNQPLLKRMLSSPTTVPARPPREFFVTGEIAWTNRWTCWPSRCRTSIPECGWRPSGRAASSATSLPSRLP